MKVLSNKEYEELKDYKQKYKEITGESFVIYVGGRTLYSRLIQLSKEQLVHLILEMREDIRRINKKMKKQYKCRVEKESDK